MIIDCHGHYTTSPKALEDFRPDSILQQVQAFQAMLALRTQLKDPKKFKDAAAAIRKLMGLKPAKKAKPATGAAAAPPPLATARPLSATAPAGGSPPQRAEQ